MTPKYEYPGIYTEEIPNRPPQLSQVKTAVPVFVGFTQKVIHDGIDYTFIPKKIDSLSEYEAIFGFPEPASIEVSVSDGGLTEEVVVSPIRFRLYYSLQLYFGNGGAPCYICSAGKYDDADDSYEALLQALNQTASIDDITLILIPDAHLSGEANFYRLFQRAMEISATLRDRFTICDIFSLDGTDTFHQIETRFKEQIGSSHLGFGAVYYPYLLTIFSPYLDEKNTMITIEEEHFSLESLKTTQPLLYHLIILSVEKQRIVLPPSAAIAGVYCRTDSARGVWKAPANVSVTHVLRSMLMIDDGIQSAMNISPDGKSVNAIRNFTGKDILVWGARTLAGNDNEWKYVPVRRLCIMIEKTIRNGLEAYRLFPNDSTTWTWIKAAVENFLTQLWRLGALAGSQPEHAFYVRIGQGSTMSAQDVANGNLIIEIGVAAVRPAEFITFRISQQMQLSEHIKKPLQKILKVRKRKKS